MWVSVNSGSWWWTGRPGVLRFMGSQRVGHDWATDLIWSECQISRKRKIATSGNNLFWFWFEYFLPILCKPQKKWDWSGCLNYVLAILKVELTHSNSTTNKGAGEGEVAQLCPTLCNPVDCNLPSFSIFGILQAKILEWVSISFSRGSSRPRDRARVSCIGGRCFNLWATREAPTTYKVMSKWSIVRKAVLWVVNKLTYTSVQFSCSVVSDPLQPHELQHARPPCPSSPPGVYPNSCPSNQYCHPIISFSAIPFSCPQSFPASGSFPMSQLLTSGGQSIGVSASISVLPMNPQDWSPLGWTGWMSLQSKGLSRVFSNTTVQKHQLFGAQLSL